MAKFLNCINSGLGGWHVTFGGSVSKKDLKGYINWLKVEYEQSGDIQSLKVHQYVVYIIPENQWILSNKVSFWYYYLKSVPLHLSPKFLNRYNCEMFYSVPS